MNHSQIAVSVCVCWLGGILSMCSHGTAAQSFSPADFERLYAVWESQEIRSSTAYLRYRHFFPNPESLRKLTLEQFEGIVQAVDLTKDPDSLGRLATAVLAARPNGKPASYTVKELFVEGTKIREKVTYDGVLSSDRVFDGENDVSLSARNRQVDVYAPGVSRLRRITLRDFPTAPQLWLEHRRDMHSQLNEVEAPDDRFRGASKSGDYRFLVDRRTGFLWQETSQHGDTIRLRIQQGPAVFPGDVEFPTVIMVTKFTGGVLASVDIRIVEDAVFNHDLPADAFTIAAEAGTNVFDYRKNPDAPIFTEILGATNDVLGALSRERGAVAIDGGGTSGDRSWLRLGMILVTVAVLALTISVAMARRRQRVSAE